jgi:predicted DCC family thiol-disulfide oxidoreductase YuxK
MTRAGEEGQPPIVFFDGLCGFCDLTVTYFFGRDKAHKLRFAPLQGPTAAAHLTPRQVRNLDSMVLLKDGVAYEGSTAGLMTMRELGGWLGLAGRVGLWMPRIVRDAVYAVVVRHRYRIFGKKDACRLPTAAERAYFLD